MVEVFANTEEIPVATLSQALTIGQTELHTTAGVNPSSLASGEFRIMLGKEILKVESGASTTAWKVQRELEGSSQATHSIGTSIFHEFTAGAAEALRAD